MKLRDANIQVYEKKVSHIFLHVFCLHSLRGCSYGGKLTRLGGLARLSEVSPSLRNSYKNIMCSYEK